MSPGTNLIVENGALKASGVSGSHITITSSKESQGAAAPGDWGQIKFLDGTIDSATLLEYVDIRFGKGISLQQAAPTFNYLAITKCTGAAIAMDLASSPKGLGNSATGNDINGISVPTGDLTNNVVWDLRGIPFVLSQGVLSIGQTPKITAISPTDIPQGQSINATITGVRLAGAESINFDQPGVTGVISSASSDTTIPVKITAEASAVIGALAYEVQVAAGKVKATGLNVINSKPPILVSSIAPNSIRRGESKAFQVIGSQLNGAQASVSGSGLTLSNLATTDTTANFNLSASSSATLGALTLTLTNTTATGSATASVNVLQTPPQARVTPAPLAVPPDSVPRSYTVSLTYADTVDHVFTASTGDTTIASVSPTTFTIPAGQTQFVQQITGKKLGQTSLTLVSDLGTLSTPIFVTTEFSGLNTAYASHIGVVKEVTTGPQTQTISPIVSPLVGVTRGGYLSGVSPQNLTIGTGPIPLTISGDGLVDVTAVSVIPSDGLVLGSLSVNPDGKSVVVPITIAANAPLTTRQVVVTAGANRIIPTTPTADRIKVVTQGPTIDSISPINAAPGTVVNLTIRGRNLADLFEIGFNPRSGITVSSIFTIDPAGTVITTTASIDASAAKGPRVLTVETLGGISDSTPSAANTFTVVTQVTGSVTPVTAPNVGVVKETPAPAPGSGTLFASNVGVAVGGVVTSMTPRSGIIGTSLDLSIQGQELGGVTSLSFNPNNGITVGAPVLAGDGKSFTAPITIDAAAPQTSRAVRILVGTREIPFARAGLNQFLVTSPQPEINATEPIYVTVGAAPVTLTVRGKNFQNAQQIKITPAGNLSISSPPTVNADGTVASVTVSAATGAITGQRVVSLVTPAGETSADATAANIVTIASAVSATFGPVAAVNVGVVKQVNTPAPTQSIGPITAPNVGVVKDLVAPPPATTTILNVAPQVGVAVGPVVSRLSSEPLVLSGSGNITLTGYSLNGVTALTFNPTDGLTAGAPQVALDGTQVIVPVTVAASASTTARQVVVNAGTARVPYSNPRGNLVVVANAAPVVVSISPILSTQGSNFTLTIRGSNFQSLRSVSFSPADGVIVGTGATVSTDGTQITIPVALTTTATLGARVVQVTTAGGTSSATASPANTFTVFAP